MAVRRSLDKYTLWWGSLYEKYEGRDSSILSSPKQQDLETLATVLRL
jgi:hypothetical protein